MSASQTRFTLYRMFNADHVLLYVGLSNRPTIRFKEHERHKDWWPLVATITTEHYLNREDLARAEAVAIRTECPRYNIAMNGGSRTTATTFDHPATLDDPDHYMFEDPELLAEMQRAAVFQLCDGDDDEFHEFFRDRIGYETPPLTDAERRWLANCEIFEDYLADFRQEFVIVGSGVNQ